jgi:hypothetical protein
MHVLSRHQRAAVTGDDEEEEDAARRKKRRKREATKTREGAGSCNEDAESDEWKEEREAEEEEDDEEEEVEEEGVLGPREGRSREEIREKVREQLVIALSIPYAASSSLVEPPEPPAGPLVYFASQAIEARLFDSCPADEYNKRARRLIFNLKQNQDMREECLANRLDPTRLVRMSSIEMATAELKQQREEIQRKAKASVVLKGEHEEAYKFEYGSAVLVGSSGFSPTQPSPIRPSCSAETQVADSSPLPAVRQHDEECPQPQPPHAVAEPEPEPEPERPSEATLLD